MKPPRLAGPRRSRGFTLVETIMVIVMLGLAAVGISAVQDNIFARQSSVKDLQIRTALMLECAEQVLAVRRFTADGYSAVNDTDFGTNKCGGVTALSGYSIPNVTITDPYSVFPACPAGGTCKLVFITQNGVTPLILMREDY